MINQVFNFVKSEFDKNKSSHSYDHTLRVYNLAVHIGEIENADLEIIKIAALLHDIARFEEDEVQGKICHAKRGAEIAQEYLKSLDLSQDKIDAIKHCILAHRNKTNIKPETIEAKVLFDADKLDSIGAIGIGRDFMFAAEIGAEFHDKDVIPSKEKFYTKKDSAYHHYLISLQFIKDKLQTKEGKRIGKERHQYMVDFFDRLNKEVDGEL